MVTVDELDAIIKEIQFGNQINVMPDWPAQRIDAYPKAEVPIILPHGSHLEPSVLYWGYHVPWNNKVLFNTRIETALANNDNMWADSLTNRRCIIASKGFYEPHRTETIVSPRTGKDIKRQYLFTMPSSPFLFMAGIYRDDRFSIMTTEPNTTMKPIHDRMPIVLEQDELNLWLHGDPREFIDRAAINLNSTALA